MEYARRSVFFRNSFIHIASSFLSLAHISTPFQGTYLPDPQLPRSGQPTAGAGRLVVLLYKVGRKLLFHRIVSNYNTRVFFSLRFSNSNKNLAISLHPVLDYRLFLAQLSSQVPTRYIQVFRVRRSPVHSERTDFIFSHSRSP